LANVKEAERAGVSGKEAQATVADLRILAWLARYHSGRLRAAVDYNLYKQTNDPAALDVAIEHERTATAAWAEMVKAAGDVFPDELAFGVHRVGFPRHWKEELVKLEAGLKSLAEERRNAPPVETKSRPPMQAPPGQPARIRLIAPGKPQPGRDLVVAVKAEDPSAIKSLRLRYRHMTQYEDYQTADMALDAKSGQFVARVPGAFIVSKWDLMYFVEMIDQAGRGRNYPDLETEMPYVIVGVERPAAKTAPK